MEQQILFHICLFPAFQNNKNQFFQIIILECIIYKENKSLRTYFLKSNSEIDQHKECIAARGFHRKSNLIFSTDFQSENARGFSTAEKFPGFYLATCGSISIRNIANSQRGSIPLESI